MKAFFAQKKNERRKKNIRWLHIIMGPSFVVVPAIRKRYSFARLCVYVRVYILYSHCNNSSHTNLFIVVETYRHNFQSGRVTAAQSVDNSAAVHANSVKYARNIAIQRRTCFRSAQSQPNWLDIICWILRGEHTPYTKLNQGCVCGFFLVHLISSGIYSKSMLSNQIFHQIFFSRW